MPIRGSGRAVTLSSSTPFSFFIAVVAKKMFMSCAACGLTTSSPKACASASRPASKPSSSPAFTTSRMRSCAG